MATPAAHLNVLVTANTKGAIYGLARVNSRMDATNAGAAAAATRFKQLAKTAAIAGGAAGLGALALGTKKAFGEFREAQKATKQTQAVLKSTGKAAKVTATEIEGLANAISLKAGIDDEAIQSAENLLLTFTKVRNETGKGNQVFNRATQTIVDMSVALDQDLKSSAIQVGKALQDPEKGITALRRVGVSFNTTQQDMITTWLEQGKTLKAQKFILAELTTEFGGSAAAQADSADKLKVAWNNMFESIGMVIGPTIERAMGALARFLNQMQSGAGAGGRFADKLRSIGQVAGSIVGFFKDNKVALDALKVALIAGAAAWGVYKVQAAAAAVATTIATGGLNLIIPALAAFAAALVIGYNKSAFLRKVMDEVAVSFRHFAKWVMNAGHNLGRFGDGVADVCSAIASVFSETFRRVKKAVGDAMAFIFRGFAKLFDLASHVPGWVGDKFDKFQKSAEDAAKSVDKAGEKTKGLGSELRALPKSKRIDIKIDASVGAIKYGGFNPLTGQPSGGPSLMDQIGGAVASKVDGKKMLSMVGPLGLAGNQSTSLEAIRQIGLSMGTSGGRGPGQGYRPGDPGFHGQNRAQDHSGSASVMMRFARFMYSQFGTKLNELIYTPLGVGIDNHRAGRLSSLYPAETLADHYDHVHVAMAKGGIAHKKVRALVGERGPEIVDLPAGARVHSNAASRRMMPQLALASGTAGKTIWDFMRGHGFSPAQSAGWLGVFQKESNFSTTVRNPSSGATGLAQWLGSRLVGLQAMRNWTALSTQLNYVWRELKGAENSAYQAIRGAKTPRGAARIIDSRYERSDAILGAEGYAADWYKKFQGTGFGKSTPKKKPKPAELRKHRPAVRRRSFTGVEARDAFMQAFQGQIAMREALANLTPDLMDDIAVATDAVRGWGAWLDLAKKKGDQSGITTAATELKSWSDRLAELNVPPEVAAAADNAAERAALLQTLLTQANQRTAVSQAQYGALKYGGQFESGGVVPGPIGSPRLIVAHGQETVTPAGAGGVQVIVNGDIINTPRGKKAVEIRDIRGHQRAPLPGRGGG